MNMKVEIKGGFFSNFYPELHGQFIKKAYLKPSERKKYEKGLSPEAWDILDKTSGDPKVTIWFAGATGKCPPRFFYLLYLAFQGSKDGNTPPIKSKEVDRLTMIRALIFIKMGKGIKEKIYDVNKEVELELDFDTLQNKNLWRRINSDDVFNRLLDVFKRNFPYIEKSADELPIKSQQDSEKSSVSDKTEKLGQQTDTVLRKGNLIGTVPSRTDDFFEREKELENLFEVLSETSNIIFLHGIPGIGKTSLVKAFIKKHRYHFDNIAWVSIDKSKEEISKNNTEGWLTKLEPAFTQLYLDLAEEKARMDWDIFQQFGHVTSRLNKVDGNNLLVIDNYDQSILAYRNKLPNTSNWKVLVTGRSEVAGLKNVPLNSLSKEEAKSLFKKFCSKDVDEDLLDKFLKEIDRHTLMIEIAAKTLDGSNFVTLADLYEKLTKGKLDDSELDYSIGTEYSSVEAKLIDQLLCLFDIRILDQNEIKILKTWYYLRPNSYTVEEINNFTVLPLEDGKLKSQLTKLSRNGWITFDSANKLYSMHRLIQNTILYALSPNTYDVQPLIEFFGIILKERTDEFDFKGLLNLQHSCDYFITQVGEEQISHPLFGQLLVDQAMTYQKAGLLFDAKCHLKNSIGVFYKLINYDPGFFGPCRRSAMIKLATVLVELNEPLKAETVLLDILNIGPYENEEIEKHWMLQSIAVYELLISVYTDLNSNKAELYLEKLSACADRHPESNFKRLIKEKRLTIYVKANDYKNAWPIGEQLYAEYTKDYQDRKMSSFDYAQKTSNHGLLLEKRKKFGEALKHYTYAANLISKLMEEKPYVYDASFASVLKGVAVMLKKMGQIEEWKNCYEEIWYVYKRIFSFQQNVCHDLVTTALTLANVLPKPTPAHIIEMVRFSFVTVGLYSKDYELKKYLLAAKSIFNWSQEDLQSFINEVDIQIKNALEKIENFKHNYK